MDIRLTKEADALICLLYKNYLQKRNDGVSKKLAKFFGSSVDIQKELIEKWTPDDTDETCWELHRSGLLSCMSADNIAYEVQLTDNGIIYMENRFKDGVNSVLDYLKKIKESVPFL